MNNNIIKYGLAIAASAVALASCTKDFERFNTNPDAVQTVDVKSYITTMELDAVIPCSDEGANQFQRACNLMGDAFSGYLSPTQASTEVHTLVLTTSTVLTTTMYRSA